MSPTHLLSVDPGLSKAGRALWRLDWGTRTAELLLAETVRYGSKNNAADWLRMAQLLCADTPEGTTALAVEAMQVDERTGRAQAHSILGLNGVVGALAGIIGAPAWVSSYTPKEWKGNMPKEVVHNRTMSRLTDAERARLRKNLGHDAKDAVAIGAFYLRTAKFNRWQRRRGVTA